METLPHIRALRSPLLSSTYLFAPGAPVYRCIRSLRRILIHGHPLLDAHALIPHSHTAAFLGDD